MVTVVHPSPRNNGSRSTSPFSLSLLVVGLSFFFLFFFSGSHSWGGELVRLLRVGSAFTAKTACTCRFVSHRSARELSQFELKGVASMFFSFHIDATNEQVTAFPFDKMFHGWGVWRKVPVSAVAVYLGPQLGCQLQPLFPPSPDAPNASNVTYMKHREQKKAPRKRVPSKRRIDSAIQAFLDFQVSKEARVFNHTRATVVMSGGEVVGEAYLEFHHIHAETKLLGWSMTKSVHAVVLGAMIQHQIGNIRLDTPVELELPISSAANQKRVTIYDLISMGDVLPNFPESYDILDSVPDMLYRSADHGLSALEYTTSKPRPLYHRQHTFLTPLWDGSNHTINPKLIGLDSGYEWYYSSGVSNLLARHLRSLFPSDEAYWTFPFENIFEQIGADFTCEIDPSGTFVASSFCYASAEDWAKLGLLLLQNGTWEGKQVIPAEYVDIITTARPRSGGIYGGSIWLNPARVGVAEYNYLSHNFKAFSNAKWMTRALPPDAYMMSGYDDQFVVVIPSLDCVISRLGLSKTAEGGNEDPNQIFSKPHFFGTIAGHCKRLLDCRNGEGQQECIN